MPVPFAFSPDILNHKVGSNAMAVIREKKKKKKRQARRQMPVGPYEEANDELTSKCARKQNSLLRGLW